MLSAQTTVQYCENCVSQSRVPLQKRDWKRLRMKIGRQLKTRQQLQERLIKENLISWYMRGSQALKISSHRISRTILSTVSAICT